MYIFHPLHRTLKTNTEDSAWTALQRSPCPLPPADLSLSLPVLESGTTTLMIFPSQKVCVCLFACSLVCCFSCTQVSNNILETHF